jgi:hypothetical protein
VAAAPELADADLTNAAELRGKVAVVSRGGCPFLEKALRAQAAGAVAVIVINNDSRNILMWLAVADAIRRRQVDDIRVPVLCVGQTDGAEFLHGPAAVAFEYDGAVKNWMLAVVRRDGQIHCGPIQRTHRPDGLYDMDWNKLQNMNPDGDMGAGVCMVLFTRQQSEGTWISVRGKGTAKAINNVKDFVLRLGQADHGRPPTAPAPEESEAELAARYPLGSAASVRQDASSVWRDAMTQPAARGLAEADHGRPGSIYDLPLGKETVGSGILNQPRLTSQNPAFQQQATSFVASGPAGDPFNQPLGGWGRLNERMQPVNGASPQLLHKAVLSNLGCCACCKPEVVQKREYAYM